MSVAQWIQNAWNKQSKWLILFRPLSWLYRAGFVFNQKLYQSGVKKIYQSPIPVMVVGNITVGGSGKTPLIIQLVRYLSSKNIRVGVISRGYGGKGPFPKLVELDSSPAEVGDEPTLIVQSTGVLMAVGPNRQQNIEMLLAQRPLDLIISDDGLQHWALGRQLEWIVLDQNRGLGNEKLLPEGFLREPKTRLEHATVIEHTKTPHSTLHMHLAVAEPYLLNREFDAPFNPQQNFYAVVGIGFPQRFYQTLESIGIHQFQCHEFPDHHDYQITDLQFEDKSPIITTEKDAVKLLAILKNNPDFNREIWVVPVDAMLSDDAYQLLNTQLTQLGLQF